MIIIFVVFFVCKSVYYLQGVAGKKYWSEISVPQIHVTVLDQFGSYWTVSYHFVCLFGPYLSYGFVNLKFQKDTFSGIPCILVFWLRVLSLKCVLFRGFCSGKQRTRESHASHFSTRIFRFGDRPNMSTFPILVSYLTNPNWQVLFSCHAGTLNRPS